MRKTWLEQYPPGVPASVVPRQPPTLVALIDEAFRLHADRPALRCLGRTLDYRRIDEDARALAAWWQARGIVRGDRVAVMLPNLPQYLVAVAAILRVGAVVVNIDVRLPTADLELRLKDCGAKAIVVLEHCAARLQPLLERLPLRQVVLAGMGDMLGWLKGRLVNHAERRDKTRVPPYRLPGAVRFNDAVARGRRLGFSAPDLSPDDIALLQYTSGTTGTCKGAVLLHRHLAANLLQAEAWFRPALARLPAGEQLVTVAALPFAHIFGFNMVMLLGVRLGGASLLVPDARDIDALIEALDRQTFHCFPAVNHLFDAVARHPEAARIDWRHLVLSVGGGTAVSPATAQRWLSLTGCAICEGYGLTEASPFVSCHPVPVASAGAGIGLPLPDTEVVLLDDEGAEVPAGAAGEIAVRGPQLMAGYWQRPDETARVMTADGFFRTGDIGSIDADGQLRIIDRKKDMILVSGFNVVPSEVEGVLSQLPGVLECGVVGVPDDRAGEVVKAVIVKRDATLTESDVRGFCEQQLTGYKRPRVIEFRNELPKTSVGRILRRELRVAPQATSGHAATTHPPSALAPRRH